MKYKGYIIWWDDEKGQGRVRSYDRSHPDLFVHWSCLPGAGVHTIVNIKDYTPVNYDIVGGFYDRAARATNIVVLGDIPRTVVVGDILARILETPSENQDIFIENILRSIYKVGRESGYLMYPNLFKRDRSNR